jgi:hypothetical protein
MILTGTQVGVRTRPSQERCFSASDPLLSVIRAEVLPK